MMIYILCCLMMSTIFCFSEGTVENLDGIKCSIELGQKQLDAKVDRYNDLLKKTYKKKQQVEGETLSGQAQEDESIDNTVLRQLSAEIEKAQETLDKRIELYNKTLKEKADQTTENDQEDLVVLLREEVQRLTNMVERLQKDVRDLKMGRDGRQTENKQKPFSLLAD